MTQKKRKPSASRISVSFPDDVYLALCELAEKNRVSLAWLIREAAFRMLKEDPLFGQSK